METIKQPYLTQQKAITETVDYLNSGKTKVINVQMCGMGKTELGAWISKNINGNILFLVHKNSILKQAYKTYKDIIQDKTFGWFTVNIKENNKQVIFASIQTLSKKRNLAMFSQDYFECIIIDECHHMATSSYNSLLKYFNSKFLLGFTATPHRLDRKPILELFDEKVGFFDKDGNDVSLLTGIELGYLSPVRYFALNDNIDYSNINHNGYKYKRLDLDKALIIEKRNELIADKWLEMAKRKKTIAFCNSIKHINSIKKSFESKGIKCASLSYKTSKRMQNVIEQQFRQGIFDVILTCELYIEGVDFPDCECVTFLRPTESERIFIQQLGRVMRRFEGKPYGLVMDFVGNQKNAVERLKWLNKYLVGKDKISAPKETKPIYYYNPLVEITINEELVDIFRQKIEITKEYLEDCLFNRKMKIKDIAIEKKVSGETIRNYLRRYGWSFLNYNSINKEELIDLYVIQKKSLKEIEDILGVGESTLYHALKYNEIPKRNGVSEDVKNKIIQMYKNGKKYKEMSKIFGLSITGLGRLLREKRIEKNRRNKLIPERDLFNLYIKNSMSTAEIAKRYNVSRSVIQNHLIKHNIKIRSLREASAMRYSKFNKENLLNEVKKNSKAYVSKKYNISWRRLNKILKGEL